MTDRFKVPQNSSDSSRLTRPAATAKRIKTEQSPNRLPSLRGPRDLTLGGIKKKTFTPNIPVRKERIKADTADAKPAVKKKEEKRSRSHDGRSKGRGRGFKSQTIIKSHSIFESGFGDPAASAGRGQATSSSTTSAASQIQKPTIKKEKVDSVKEKWESEEAMRRLDEADGSFISDLQNDDNLKPAVLPLRSRETKADLLPKQLSHMSAFAGDAFRTNDLILLQIPDTLPGMGPSEDDEAKQAEKQDSRGAGKQESKTTSGAQQGLPRCSIAQLAEGRIGKLQILKSGRCRLVLEGVQLDLKMGTPASFVQEIVSVRLPPEGSGDAAKGHVSVLGEVGRKVVCVPNMTNLVGST